MNKQEAVKQNIKSLQYLENNKLRPFFNELTKLILLKKPDDPIQFLLDYLEKNNKRQIICLQGYDEENRVKLAKNISNKYNYKVLQLAQLFKGVVDYNSKPDKQINEKVLAQINKVETIYKGIIISGYPNNIIQSDFIQKSGILPERYFCMVNDEATIMNAYNQKYTGNVSDILQRNKLELKELNEILGDLIDYLPEQLEKATQKVIQTILLKFNKKSSPFDSPRVLVLYPPYLKPISSLVFTNIFSLNPISINETLKKLSHNEGFIIHVQSYIRKNKCISKQIELAMIQTMTKNAASKNKGFVLYGWPNNKDRLPLLKEHYLKPHLILIFEADKEKSLQKFQQLDANSPDLFAITKKPAKEEYVRLYEAFIQTVDELRGKNNVQTFSWDESPERVIKTFVNLMDNPKIYN